ncbi:HU-CCDC81 and SPOR domain-containing protein [Streptomyces sp. PTY087I2]|uniref:pPIWI_RE_Y domain-containing protein n=1 Tax=Streptomyces sp. PTY087I2 TaxID=1819298 RepID=UPI00080B4E04|nr:HU-CCDC81 and SPOR domain-containing protein [Streptomyces sp. PTY087I2]OCC07670.1 hypothetical protein A3Q37_06559 [Streptomyces sp. PTY087I2]
MTLDAGALVSEIAEAISELGEEIDLRSFLLPYPDAAQRALDRMVLHCIDLGLEPPKGLPELIEWCRHRSVGDRAFDIPPALILSEATLVHPEGLLPTRTCLELASAGTGGGMEGEARKLLAELADRCGSEERFHRSRQFLALNPVVRGGERFGRRPAKGTWSREVWSQVRDLYRPLPRFLAIEGTLLLCATCRLPALLGGRRVPDRRTAVSGPKTWCEREICPYGLPMDLIRPTDGVLLLAKPLRIFLSLPLPLEQAALAELNRAAVGHHPLPGELGTYRLQGDGLAVHRLYIHDRVQPVLLSHRFVSAEGPVAVVVPEELARSARYRTAFFQALPDPDQVLLTGPVDLVARLRDARTVGGDVLNETENERRGRCAI